MAVVSVSKIHRFVESFENHCFYIGIDVHKKSWSVALLREDGLMEDFVMPPEPSLLTSLLENLPIQISSITYEAGPTGFGLARYLQAHDYNVIVAPPSRIPRPVTAGAKTDRLDCRKLAELSSSGLLHSIAIPRLEEEALRALVRRRHQITDSLRRVKQRIRSLLLLLGMEEPPQLDSWGKRALEVLANLELPSVHRDTLHSHLRELEFFSAEQRHIDKRVEQILGQFTPQTYQALKSVPGVGHVVASSYLAEVFRPQRFDEPGQVASYLGLAPMVHQSGGKKDRGRLRPVGQQRLRSLLIEAAWIWKNKDEQARELYNRLIGKHGIPQKAITAVARQLAILLWRLSLQNRIQTV